MFSCSKEELGPQCIDCTDENTQTTPTDVLIINEGNFGFGNGSISLYNPSTQSVSQNVFLQSNNSIPLGDVVQSITQVNTKAYVVINNSNKIEVIDINNFNSLATITGFNSPRYFLPMNSNTAYVTDLYSNSIQVVDLNNNAIISSIALSGWTEELLLYNDTVYVCDMTNNNLLLINSANNTLIDSVKLGKQPNSLVLDQNNKIWIMCDGGFNQSNPELIRYNPQTRTIEATFVFPNVAESPGTLKINDAKDQLYFINANVYTMSINDAILPIAPFISSNSNTFYALGIDPNNNEVYVSDAIDFVQNGVIFRYTVSGSLIHQFNSGIIPGTFLFIQ